MIELHMKAVGDYCGLKRKSIVWCKMEFEHKSEKGVGGPFQIWFVWCKNSTGDWTKLSCFGPEQSQIKFLLALTGYGESPSG